MKEKHQGFSLDGFAKYYDLLTPAERSAFRRKQVELSGIGTGEKVLDVGCGTGALSLLAKVAVGATGEAAGIDISPNMISRAREKAAAAGLDIDFRVASVDRLPYPNDHFDAVTSTLMFHHLPVDLKMTGLQEIRRVLKTEGWFFLGDFMTPRPLMAPLMALLLIWNRSTRYQLFGNLPGLIEECGFSAPEIINRGALITYCRITKA